MSQDDPIPLRPNVVPIGPQDQEESLPEGHIQLVVTYMEMTAPPGPQAVPRPALPLAIMRAVDPPVHFYRYLYNTIGAPWLWWERRLIADEVLAALLADPLVEVYVLYANGVPAGYAELDRRPFQDRKTGPGASPGKDIKPDENENSVELSYFGLMPDFTGRGIGPFFLDQMMRQAWTPPDTQSRPDKLLVNTCNLDHPKALNIYQRVGFQIVERVSQVIEDPKKHF